MISNSSNEFTFLQKNGIEDAIISDVISDASFRRYKRIIKDKTSIILAIYPPSEIHCFESFIKIAHYLKSASVSVPEIIDHDYTKGMMLIEDFGDATFTKIISHANKFVLYQLSIDVISAVQKLPMIEGLRNYSIKEIHEGFELFIEYYLQYRNVHVNDQERKDFFNIIGQIFSEKSIKNEVICLRDFHSPNLMYLHDRSDIQKIGVIDFQDALFAPRIYDVVSLIHDARIMIEKNLADLLIQRYLQNNPDYDRENFCRDFALISLQRNFRILGVFARQKIKYSNNNYELFIPILTSYLKIVLENKVLCELKKWLKKLNIF